MTTSFSFPPSLLHFQLWQHLQLLSVEQIPAITHGVLCLAVCMAEDFSSSVANSTVSCSTCSVSSKPVPAKECVSVLLPLCCSVYTAHPGVWSIQSWTTSLILARVSWSGTFSSSHDLPAWDSKSKALLALRTYLLYMPQYLQALPRNTAVSGAGCLVVELSTTKQCFLKLSTLQIVQLRWCGWDEQTWAASCVCSKVPLGLKKLWVWKEDQGEEVFCFVFFFNLKHFRKDIKSDESCYWYTQRSEQRLWCL